MALVADAIKDVSARNAIVLDAFGGSGSTLIAAHKTGRRACLIELDPVYVDRIIRRWQAYAKDDAILAATGECFDDLANQQRRQGDAGNAENRRSVRQPSPEPADHVAGESEHG